MQLLALGYCIVSATKWIIEVTIYFILHNEYDGRYYDWLRLYWACDNLLASASLDHKAKNRTDKQLGSQSRIK